MTVAQLKVWLANQMDDALVVVPGKDHSFREVKAFAEVATRWQDGGSGHLWTTLTTFSSTCARTE